MGESKNDLILKAIEVHPKYTEMLNQSDLLALQWLERVDKALRLGEN